MRGEKLLLALGAAAAVGLVAFGAIQLTNDDDQPNDDVPQPSANTSKADLKKELFIRKADRLCARASARVDALMVPDNLAEASAYYGRLGTMLDGLVKNIKKLERPPQGRKLLHKMFTTLDKLIGGARQLSALAAAGDDLAVEALNGKLDNLNRKANAQALKYGLVTCGEPT